MKRILSVIFMLVLSLSLLAGCNQAQDTVKEEAQEAMTKAASAVVTPSPTAAQLEDGYFSVVAGIEKGTAGSSLKLARGAANAFAFAQDYATGSVKQKTFRDNMLEAWNSLSEEEQANFDENFLDVVNLLKDVTADNLPAVFEDAGVADLMRENLAKDNAMKNWDALTANTLTLGNSED